MGTAMNDRPAPFSMDCRPAIAMRRGIGLLEVIACTALVAVMMIPIAGVIRASGQSIRQAQGGGTTHASMRTTLRWLRETIQSGQVLAISASAIRLQTEDGRLVRIAVRSGDLVADDGATPIPLASDVRDIRFAPLRSSVPPHDRIGIQVRLRARDSSTGQTVSVACVLAETPQI
jgi:hypothetical protein